MKYLILISVFVGLVISRPNLPNYEIANEHFDVDALVADLASLHAYSNCLLDRGPCTTLGHIYRDITQECVIYACDRCTVRQKQQYGKYLQGLKATLPQEYQSYREKYDPENIYFDVLEAELFKFIH